MVAVWETIIFLYKKNQALWMKELNRIMYSTLMNYVTISHCIFLGHVACEELCKSVAIEHMQSHLY